MYKSRKYQVNSLYAGDFSLCDVILTRHAKQRCKERHIKSINVQNACTIVKGRYVITVWQKQSANYGRHCTKGVDYMRSTNKNKVIPKEVLKIFRQPKKSSVHRSGQKNTKKPKSAKGYTYVKWDPNRSW